MDWVLAALAFIGVFGLGWLIFTDSAKSAKAPDFTLDGMIFLDFADQDAPCIYLELDNDPKEIRDKKNVIFRVKVLNDASRK